MKRVRNLWVISCFVIIFLPLLFHLQIVAEETENQASTYEKLWDDTNEAYMISTVEDLKIFRESLYEQVDYSGKTVYLLNDITLEEDSDVGTVGTVSDVETSIFQGAFNGRGHFIKGWSNPNEALFLTIGNEGKVSNLTMKDVNVTDASLGIMFAFQNGGTITSCAVSGCISGEKNSYSSFCYANSGTITDCISAADISTTKAKSQLAGIVYSNSGTVTNCIYFGTLSTTQTSRISLYGIANKNVTNSYYLENENYKKVGIACTEEILKLQSTYVGFDFEHIWIIDAEQNDGFPMLYTDFPDLQFVIKVPVSIEVQVKDYTFDETSAMGACYFPLDTRIAYAGNDEKIEEQFSDLVSTYQVKTSLREANWQQQFLVDVPVNGVSQDFSKTCPDDYFDFTYKKNDDYEFYVTSWNYSSAKGTYFDRYTDSNSLSETQKTEKILKADEAVRTILNAVYQKYGAEAMDNTWFDFTCARANYYPVGVSQDEMFSRMSNVWREYKDYQASVGKRPETTETSRFVLAITAIGFDPTDVSGDNLIKELIDSDANGKYFAPHYLAYALYSGRYGDYLSYAKGLVKEQIVSSKQTVYSADDMATMYMQPIFLMYNKNASISDVDAYAIKTYVEGEVIPWLQRSITGFGTFYSPYTHCNNNVWTDAQAQMLLALLKVDFFSDSFVKNGNTILDYIIQNPLLSLNYQGDESQCARAIVSLTRCYRGQNDLFDCSDVTGVREVEALISSLPATIKEDDTDEVYRVKGVYQSLTAGQQKQVDNVAVLNHALSCLEQIQIDKEIAGDMELKIALIGPVTLDKEKMIQELRQAYNNLTAAQKARVTNYQVLIDAEQTLKRLQEEEAKRKKEEEEKKRKEESANNSDKSNHKNKGNKQGRHNKDKTDNMSGSNGNNESDNQNRYGVGQIIGNELESNHSNQNVNGIHTQVNGNIRLPERNKVQSKQAKGKGKEKSKKNKTNNSIGPNRVLGESSLLLNDALADLKSNSSSVPLWCYTGIFGIGILLLAIGFRIEGKSVKEEKSEQVNEEENS